MPPDPNARTVFRQMNAELTPAEDPGYLQYWEMRGANEVDQRIEQIVRGLTRVALRGEGGRAEFTDREPALQARYWYRSLGPLNPMTDVEPDLVTAVSMMYGREAKNPSESANLRIDSAYALAELAHLTTNPATTKEALRLGVGVVQDIKTAFIICPKRSQIACHMIGRLIKIAKRSSRHLLKINNFNRWMKTSANTTGQVELPTFNLVTTALPASNHHIVIASNSLGIEFMFTSPLGVFA